VNVSTTPHPASSQPDLLYTFRRLQDPAWAADGFNYAMLEAAMLLELALWVSHKTCMLRRNEEMTNSSTGTYESSFVHDDGCIKTDQPMEAGAMATVVLECLAYLNKHQSVVIAHNERNKTNNTKNVHLFSRYERPELDPLKHFGLPDSSLITSMEHGETCLWTNTSTKFTYSWLVNCSLSTSPMNDRERSEAHDSYYELLYGAHLIRMTPHEEYEDAEDGHLPENDLRGNVSSTRSSRNQQHHQERSPLCPSCSWNSALVDAPSWVQIRSHSNLQTLWTADTMDRMDSASLPGLISQGRSMASDSGRAKSGGNMIAGNLTNKQQDDPSEFV